MRRSAAAGLSVLIAYLVSALSGINRWAYVWLKSFYPTYAAMMWVALLVIVVLSAKRAEKLHRSLLFFGAAVGYLAGIVAYNLGPVVSDGSFARSVSSIKLDGVVTYLELSAFYPLLLLSPVTGMVSIGTFAALVRSKKVDRYFALATVSVVLLAGWAFFLMRGALPPRW